jgi:hypothetical protein
MHPGLTSAASLRVLHAEAYGRPHGQVPGAFLFSAHARNRDSRMSKPGQTRAKKRPRPAVLCILDGWGCRPDADDNAITRANAEKFRRPWDECPNVTPAN